MRRAVLLGLLIALALSSIVNAQSRWGFVSWQADAPLSSAWRVEIDRAERGIVASDNDRAPTVVVINFVSDGCWRVRLYDGDRLIQQWTDKERCYYLYAPLVGELWAP